MTVAAYAVGSILVLAVVVGGAGGPGSRAAISQIAVLATVVALIGVVVLLSRRAALERALAEIRAAQSVVVSATVAPRPDVAALIGELRRLGFETVGATDTLIGARLPIRTWVMTESGGPGTTWAEVGSARTPIAILLSQAGDGRFLETVYPDGATIDHPNVFTHPIETSVEAAVADHRALLAEWTSRAGPPLVVRSLHEYRHVETEIRARTGGLMIAAHLEHVVVPGLRHWAISAAIGLLTVLALVLLAALRQ